MNAKSSEGTEGRETQLRRPYVAAVILIGFVVLLRIVPFDFGVTEHFKPDNWAEMSFAVGAAMLAVVGIITSVVISGENDRRSAFVDDLTFVLQELERKARSDPDRTLTEVYGNSLDKLRATIDERQPMKYSVSTIGIFSFFSFLVSALLALENQDFRWIYCSFLLGVALLVGYVVYCIEEFWSIDKFSSVPEKKGNLTLQAVRINGQALYFETESKEPEVLVTQRIRRMQFDVRSEGQVRNGFFHAIIRYANGRSTHIPEPNTYLGDTVFADGWNLVISPDRRLDTGIIQGNGPIGLSFEVCRDTADNPPMGEVPLRGLGTREIRRYCSIPDGFIAESVELRVYEDPLFRSNYKRRPVDLVTVQLIRNRTQT